jgi:hypothetical protein
MPGSHFSTLVNGKANWPLAFAGCLLAYVVFKVHTPHSHHEMTARLTLTSFVL